jgi:pimeloyl-ACP methyl ester carboxylesterase
LTTERDITFKSGSLQLAGTLMLPDSPVRVPAVVLIAGSGQVDRDENAKQLPINVLREIADYLAAHGIATLRYDKRGVGASEGSFWDAGFLDNVADASAALAWLKSQERVRPDAVFLLGHSEGALIATRLAGTGAEVAGAILLSGSAHSGEEILLWQATQVVKGLGGFNGWLIRTLRIDVLKTQRKELEKIKQSKANWYRRQLIAKINAKWMREFMAYDPADDLPKIQVPVLAITGSKDIQVDPADLVRMASLVTSPFEAHEMPNLTHILRAEPGQPTLSTYKQQAAQPVDRRVLDVIGDWLARELGRLPTARP